MVNPNVTLGTPHLGTKFKPRIPMSEQLFLEHPSWPVTDRDVIAASEALFNVPAIPVSSEYYFTDDEQPFDPSTQSSRGGVLHIVVGGYVVVRLFVCE